MKHQLSYLLTFFRFYRHIGIPMAAVETVNCKDIEWNITVFVNISYYVT